MITLLTGYFSQGSLFSRMFTINTMPFHAGYPTRMENMQFLSTTSTDHILPGMVKSDNPFPISTRINRSLSRVRRVR
jgi:hypothetical protein